MDSNRIETDEYNKTSELEEQFEAIDQILDPRFGEIIILRNRSNQDDFIMAKEKHSQNQQDFERDIQQAKERMSFSHDYLLQMLDFSTRIYESEEEPGSVEFSVIGFYEYPGHDLSTEISERAAQNNYFTAHELLCLEENLLKILNYLRSFKMIHGDIRPKYVFYDYTGGEGHKLVDRLGDPSPPNLVQQQNIRKREPLYLSPILYQGLVNKQGKIKHNPFKSDAFSLGLIILEAGLLKPIQSIYGDNEIKEEQFLGLLEDFLAIYNNNRALKESLLWLLDLDEKGRKDAGKVLRLLNELKKAENNEKQADEQSSGEKPLQPVDVRQADHQHREQEQKEDNYHTFSQNRSSEAPVQLSSDSKVDKERRQISGINPVNLSTPVDSLEHLPNENLELQQRGELNTSELRKEATNSGLSSYKSNSQKINTFNSNAQIDEVQAQNVDVMVGGRQGKGQKSKEQVVGLASKSSIEENRNLIGKDNQENIIGSNCTGNELQVNLQKKSEGSVNMIRINAEGMVRYEENYVPINPNYPRAENTDINLNQEPILIHKEDLTEHSKVQTHEQESNLTEHHKRIYATSKPVNVNNTQNGSKAEHPLTPQIPTRTENQPIIIQKSVSLSSDSIQHKPQNPESHPVVQNTQAYVRMPDTKTSAIKTVAVTAGDLHTTQATSETFTNKMTINTEFNNSHESLNRLESGHQLNQNPDSNGIKSELKTVESKKSHSHYTINIGNEQEKPRPQIPDQSPLVSHPDYFNKIKSTNPQTDVAKTLEIHPNPSKPETVDRTPMLTEENTHTAFNPTTPKAFESGEGSAKQEYQTYTKTFTNQSENATSSFKTQGGRIQQLPIETQYQPTTQGLSSNIIYKRLSDGKLVPVSSQTTNVQNHFTSPQPTTPVNSIGNTNNFVNFASPVQTEPLNYSVRHIGVTNAVDGINGAESSNQRAQRVQFTTMTNNPNYPSNLINHNNTHNFQSHKTEVRVNPEVQSNSQGQPVPNSLFSNFNQQSYSTNNNTQTSQDLTSRTENYHTYSNYQTHTPKNRLNNNNVLISQEHEKPAKVGEFDMSRSENGPRRYVVKLNPNQHTVPQEPISSPQNPFPSFIQNQNKTITTTHTNNSYSSGLNYTGHTFSGNTGGYVQSSRVITGSTTEGVLARNRYNLTSNNTESTEEILVRNTSQTPSFKQLPPTVYASVIRRPSANFVNAQITQIQDYRYN